MTPDELQMATSEVEKQASRLNEELTQIIADGIMHRFEKYGEVKLSASDEYRIKTMMRAGSTYNEIMQAIQTKTKGLDAEIKKVFKQTATNLGKVKTNSYVRKKATEAIKQNESGSTVKRVKTGAINEKDLTANQKKILEDVYRRTQNEIADFYGKTAYNGVKIYQNAVDEAIRKVQSGIGWQKAVREAIKEVAKKGMYVEYPSGRMDTIETAILRAVRTGVNQANSKLVLERAAAEGQDLILVSSHMDARPTHQIWQGKIYSLSGNSKKYPEFYSATGYGTAEGLCGVNCRHTIMIYYPGVTRNPFKRYNRPANKKRYEKSQKQRKMEREIRKTRRRKNVLEASKKNTDDPELKRQLNEEIQKEADKLREQKKAYDDFIKKNELKKDAIRMQVPKYDTTQLKKAVDAAKASGRVKSYENSKKVPMEKSKNTGYTKRTKEEFEQIARQIREEVTEYSDRPSKWSGNINVKDSLLNGEAEGIKEWSCDISLLENAGDGTVWHEMLHSCSASYYKPDVYSANEFIEEATVEWLTQQICEKKGIVNTYAYMDKISVLKALNNSFAYGTDLEFAKEIFNIPLPERYRWLEDKVDESLRQAKASFEDYNEIMGFVENLKGGTHGRH